MKILDNLQVNQKIKRMAIEIIEKNYAEKEIYLAGINNNGLRFAEGLHSVIKDLSDITFHIIPIKLNPADPISEDISIGEELKKLHDKVVILVDDVANSGRTIFYAFKPLLTIVPKKVQVAVLIDRKHKSFPIHVDYVGLSLATTAKENIDVSLKTKNKYQVDLNE